MPGQKDGFCYGIGHTYLGSIWAKTYNYAIQMRVLLGWFSHIGSEISVMDKAIKSFYIYRI